MTLHDWWNRVNMLNLPYENEFSTLSAALSEEQKAAENVAVLSNELAAAKQLVKTLEQQLTRNEESLGKIRKMIARQVHLYGFESSEDTNDDKGEET